MSSKPYDYLPERGQTRVLKTLPETLQGIACCICERAQSRWFIDWDTEDDDKAYLCALCILYSTEWGKSVRAPIEEVIMAVQKERNALFEKDGSNRLILSKDADDVLGVIVLAGRVAGVQRITGAAVESMKSEVEDE